MAEKKADPYESWIKQVDPKFNKTTEYLSKLKIVHAQAVHNAAEKIKYDFKKIGSEDGLNLYAGAIHEELKKGIHEKLGYKMGNSPLEDQIMQSLGGVTKDQIVKLLKTKGADFKESDIEALLNQSQSAFGDAHYQAVISEHVDTMEDKQHFLKYFDIADLIEPYHLNTQALGRVLNFRGQGRELTGSLLEQFGMQLKAKKIKKAKPKPQ